MWVSKRTKEARSKRPGKAAWEGSPLVTVSGILSWIRREERARAFPAHRAADTQRRGRSVASSETSALPGEHLVGSHMRQGGQEQEPHTRPLSFTPAWKEQHLHFGRPRWHPCGASWSEGRESCQGQRAARKLVQDLAGSAWLPVSCLPPSLAQVQAELWSQVSGT